MFQILNSPPSVQTDSDEIKLKPFFSQKSWFGAPGLATTETCGEIFKEREDDGRDTGQEHDYQQ